VQLGPATTLGARAFWSSPAAVLHPGHGLGAAALPLGEGEDVAAEVAVAALDVGEPVALLVEDLDPSL
jgi:hypothetical protein